MFPNIELEATDKSKQFRFFHYTGNSGADRYFKVDVLNKRVWQIVLNAGSPLKKGRGHMEGVYKIAFASFQSGYGYWFGKKCKHWQMAETTERQYLAAKEKIILTF